MIYVGARNTPLDGYPLEGTETSHHTLASCIVDVRKALTHLIDVETPSCTQAVSQMITDLNILPVPATHKDRCLAVHTLFLNDVQIPSNNPSITRDLGFKTKFGRATGPFKKTCDGVIARLKYVESVQHIHGCHYAGV